MAKKITEREAFDFAEVNSNFNEELQPQRNSKVLFGSDVGEMLDRLTTDVGAPVNVG